MVPSFEKINLLRVIGGLTWALESVMALVLKHHLCHCSLLGDTEPSARKGKLYFLLRAHTYLVLDAITTKEQCTVISLY